MEKQTWIVVANGKQVRILSSEMGGPLQEVNHSINPEAHVRGREHLKELPGKTFDVSGEVPEKQDVPVSVKENEMENRARALAKHLETEHSNQTYQRLYLVASPAFLGLVRKFLTANVQATIGGEVVKDLTAHTPDQIREHLPEFL